MYLWYLGIESMSFFVNVTSKLHEIFINLKNNLVFMNWYALVKI
ncbi:hypothetical Protein YC6258_05059 [Gynuella sunshinyii YC6258]|uniref:Uncharacterized protein n=1 Tax=Gynuella sunshinyii YC6258 TaxID=1445510 RepID=A0A0C5W351_9GAMM|nr:hypothetical Protein YC6258_05059 [Gynuella sunshinyii YC6258]